jgi:hypothetical protein
VGRASGLDAIDLAEAVEVGIVAEQVSDALSLHVCGGEEILKIERWVGSVEIECPEIDAFVGELQSSQLEDWYEASPNICSAEVVSGSR